jgi:lipoprotein-anchoring transpeptidase ErfK/SrfK
MPTGDEPLGPGSRPHPANAQGGDRLIDVRGSSRGTTASLCLAVYPAARDPTALADSLPGRTTRVRLGPGAIPRLGRRRIMRHVAAAAVSALVTSGCAHGPTEEWPRGTLVAGALPAPAAPLASELPEANTRRLTIRLATQDFVYEEDDRVVLNGPISSGKASSPTITGRFRVQGKQVDKVSSKYTNELGEPAWMPYSIQFHGPYFIHEGWLPGYPASHGCVRLQHEDAVFLYDRMKIGDRVIVDG